MFLPAFFPSVVRRFIATLFCGLLVVTGLVTCGDVAHAITAPELRGQRAVQDITADMHGWPEPVWSQKHDTDACFERMVQQFVDATPRTPGTGGVKLAMG